MIAKRELKKRNGFGILILLSVIGGIGFSFYLAGSLSTTASFDKSFYNEYAERLSVFHYETKSNVSKIKVEKYAENLGKNSFYNNYFPWIYAVAYFFSPEGFSSGWGQEILSGTKNRRRDFRNELREGDFQGGKFNHPDNVNKMFHYFKHNKMSAYVLYPDTYPVKKIVESGMDLIFWSNFLKLIVGYDFDGSWRGDMEKKWSVHVKNANNFKNNKTKKLR